jgi:hypothetical protein
MMKARILTVIILLVSLAAQSQSAVSATVDRKAILIGEKIQLTLEATLPPSINDWFTIDTLPHFEILEQSAIDTTQSISGRRLRQTITLTSWDSGSWTIPSLSLQRFKTRPVAVAVGHTPMDYNQPYHDIKDILEVQKPRKSNWYWYLVGIAVLIALFLLFFPPKNKEEKAVPDVAVYPDSLRRLDALDPSTEPKIFHTELVQVFRNYLQRRKGIASFTQTTDDLSVQLKKLQLPEETYTPLVQSLRMSDAVKFAKYRPGIEENKQALGVVRQAIQTIEGKSK